MLLLFKVESLTYSIQISCEGLQFESNFFEFLFHSLFLIKHCYSTQKYCFRMNSDNDEEILRVFDECQSEVILACEQWEKQKIQRHELLDLASDDDDDTSHG